jgi:hypothetical protein
MADPNCITYWLPKLDDVVNTPRTAIVHALCDLTPMLDGDEVPEAERLFGAIEAAAHEVGGFPIFLRTGHGSGKHHWKDACFVPDAASIPSHVFRIVEWSALADIMGLPTEVWAVRELLTPQPGGFKAFDGMPVGREVRFFVRRGEVVGHLPYWPSRAIELGWSRDPLPEDWEVRLRFLNNVPYDERPLLHAWAEGVAAAFDDDPFEAWSVDFYRSAEGHWYVIDMAVAEQSWGWNEVLNGAT